MGENIIKRLIEFLQGGARDARGQRHLSWFARTKFGNGVIEVLRELESVTWPSKEDVRGSTVVVLITVAIFALYAGLWDLVMTHVERLLY
ncbi:MAG: preprotein translocase subunit SecE [bacterium]